MAGRCWRVLRSSPFFLCFLVWELSLVAAKVKEAEGSRGLTYTMVGTPDFIAPLVVGEDAEENMSLCYQVQGRGDKTFNLLHASCVTVNAEYSSPTGSSEQLENVVKKVGIRVRSGNNGNLIRILVDHSSKCALSVDGVPVKDTYTNGDVRIKKESHHIVMTLPDCYGNMLTIRGVCTKLMLEKVVKLNIVRHSVEGRYHGLIGQFWGARTTYKKYHHGTIDNLYEIAVSPPHSSTRTFLGEFHNYRWDGHRAPCMYVGTADGGTNNFGTNFQRGSSVIEGSSEDYMVSSVFQNDFKFSKAKHQAQANDISIPTSLIDSIVAGSLYSVVVQTHPKPVSLCYEIMGDPGMVYSIVSHSCLNVNVRYVPAQPQEQDITLIDEIDLVSESGSIVKINADKCKVDINGTAVVEDMTTGDFSMRKRGHVVEMHYQNCSESGFKLWVECIERTTPLGMSYLKLTIDHKSVPSAPIGGLIGQFWEQTVTYMEDFERKLKSIIAKEDDTVDAYVTVSDSSGVKFIRRFPSELTNWRWDGKAGLCLYVGNNRGGASQGGRDSVIRGRIEDYVLNDSLET